MQRRALKQFSESGPRCSWAKAKRRRNWIVLGTNKFRRGASLNQIRRSGLPKCAISCPLCHAKQVGPLSRSRQRSYALRKWREINDRDSVASLSRDCDENVIPAIIDERVVVRTQHEREGDPGARKVPSRPSITLTFCFRLSLVFWLHSHERTTLQVGYPIIARVGH